MIKRTAVFFFCLLAAAYIAPAQVKSPSNYAPGREALASDTFKELVEMSSLLDKMNLAHDLASGDRLIAGHAGMRTALLENIIFAYCDVSDSLKTVENLRVSHLIQRQHYSHYASAEWEALGRNYAAARAAIEYRGAAPVLLLLPADPLASCPEEPRIRWERAVAPPGTLVPRN